MTKKSRTALWKPMLAAKPDPEELDAVLAVLPYPALFSPKLDGIRATVQNGRLYSRSLKLIPNKAMQALWGREELEGLDGEIVVGPPTAADCFNRTTSVVMARDKAADGASFYVFDSFSDLRFSTRLDVAQAMQENNPESRIVHVRHKLIRSMKELAAFESWCLDKGYEGVMRRDSNGAYKQGRSTLKEGGLVAVKRFVDAEAVILGTYEQMENTNTKTVNELGRFKRSSHKAGKVGKSTLGGFVVGMKGLGTGQKFQIGTGVGLTEAVRKSLWMKRAGLKGKLIKFRYQKIGTMAAPRQPIFLGFRGRKDL